MGQNVEWKYGKKNMCKYFWFFISTDMYLYTNNDHIHINVHVFFEKTIGHHV